MNRERILYHYTSIEGVNGILGTRSLWMSDCRYLNDRYELTRASELFVASVPSELKKPVEEALEWSDLSRRHCVFSLSESPEILSQWRAYGADGRGMALGFDEKHLASTRAEHSGRIVDCVYNDHEDFIESSVMGLEGELDALGELYEQCRGAVNCSARDFLNHRSTWMRSLPNCYA